MFALPVFMGSGGQDICFICDKQIPEKEFRTRNMFNQALCDEHGKIFVEKYGAVSLGSEYGDSLKQIATLSPEELQEWLKKK